MYLTVYYKNGIVEEFTLSLKSAQNLIKRLIESKSVNKIMSVDKVIYEVPLYEFTPEFKKLKMLYDEADRCFFAAELDVAGGIGYFPVDPMKKRMPENIYKRNQIVKGNNFISAKEKIKAIEKEFIELAKKNVNEFTEEERKQAVKWRYEFKKMISLCDHYINIFHGQKPV